MAIRRLQAEPAAPQAPTIKRVANAAPPEDGGTGFATKEELQDRLIIVTMRDFDPAHPGKFGPTPKSEVDVVDVESGEEYLGFWAFSNLAKQMGAGLGTDEIGVGRIVSGPTRSGTGVWWGIEWATADEDFAAAEKRLADKPQY